MSNFTQKNQSIQGDQMNIGGNQVIQNIVLVGQFLDLAQVQNLLPKHVALSNTKSIADAFEKEFNQRFTPELAQSTAETGQILVPILRKWAPKNDFFAVPLDEVLNDLVEGVGVYFSDRNYWQVYSKKTRIFDSSLGVNVDLNFIILEAVNLIYKNQKKTQKKFTVGFTTPKVVKIYDHISDVIQVEFSELPYDELQLFLSGIILDTIRLCSATTNHAKFWRDIVNILDTND